MHIYPNTLKYSITGTLAFAVGVSFVVPWQPAILLLLGGCFVFLTGAINELMRIKQR